ncbi:MAG: response regulator transcription factor [Eubacterium sp.]|nr:response regulator transcription factor [Eubacterium sp.]
MIYILEDDNSIRELIVYSLNSSGLEAMGFERPSDFWNQLKVKTPSLLLLDIMLPEEDGLTVLKKLRMRSETRKMPIIMLTAKGTEYDKVKGLDAGADDYISKPFGMMELISRVKALLRRTGEEPTEKCLTLGELAVYPERHRVKVSGQTVELTLKEFELLHLMMNNPGIVFSRDQIQDTIWGYAFDGESRTVDVHIRTLRQKLGDAGHLIRTVRGVGYCVTLPE